MRLITRERLADDPRTAVPGPGYRWIALSNTTLGTLMATINGSIILIALPDIFRGIGVNPLLPGNASLLLWLILGYLLVTAVLVVTFGRPRPPAPASTTQPTSHHDQAAIVKGQPYGACQTVTALASGRRPQRPIVAGSPRRTRDVFRTGNPGEASSVTDAHNWAFRVTQKRQPDHLQAAQIGDMRALDTGRKTGLTTVSTGGGIQGSAQIFGPATLSTPAQS